MDREEFLRVWGYLDMLQTRLEHDLSVLEADTSKEPERKQSIEADYTKWVKDISGLKVKIQQEADLRNEEGQAANNELMADLMEILKQHAKKD